MLSSKSTKLLVIAILCTLSAVQAAKFDPLVSETNDGASSADGEIPGFAAITSPLEPTGRGRRFDIGGGQHYGDELDDVPWQRLRPGDVVNLFHRGEPYNHKVLLSEQGTAQNPIVINGVTDNKGNRPTIDGAGATSVNPREWDIDLASSLILLHRRKTTGEYGENAEHYIIQNLRLTGVRPSNSYVHGGIRSNYPAGGRAVWSAGGQYIVMQGMVIENNEAGIFVQAGDDPGSLSRAWTIRGSKFENNGSGSRDHQIYLQAVSVPPEKNIVEGNYFGPPTPGQSSVAQLKIRATGAIVRYNWFNSAHRTLDIVEAQDAIPGWMYRNYSAEQIRDEYRSSHVYGNVFVNDHKASTGQVAFGPLHFGADTLEEDVRWYGSSGEPRTESGMRGYESPTYFYHNTVYTRADSGDIYSAVLFDADNNNSEVTPTPGTVEAWNNIIEFAGDTRIGAMNRSGTTVWRGANLVYTDTLTAFGESYSYAKAENPGNDPSVEIIVDGAIISESAALRDVTTISLSQKDFALSSGSPAVGKAADLPQHLSAFPVLLQPNGQKGGAIKRSTTNDLGALGQ